MCIEGKKDYVESKKCGSNPGVNRKKHFKKKKNSWNRKINVLLHAYNKLFASIDSRPTAYFSTRTSEPDWIRDCDERALMDSDSTQKWKTVVKERKD